MIKIKIISSNIGYAANTYLIISDNQCAVIDPSADFNSEDLEGTELKYILLTHAHFDHFLEIESWIKNSSAKVIVSENDREALSDSHRNCYALFMYKDNGYNGDASTVKDGDTLSLGNEEIEVWGVPGHTPGSLMFKVENHTFVGDLAFEGGGYGRFDLPGGDARALVDSLKKLLKFDDNTMLYPGHGPKTSIKEYRKHLQI